VAVAPGPGQADNDTAEAAALSQAESAHGPCVPVTAPPPSAPLACTISITASLAGLGIKPGAGLYSLTGLSVYLFGSGTSIPDTRVALGVSNQADSTAALDQNGTGTTAATP
jgi:hypothetical protein